MNYTPHEERYSRLKYSRCGKSGVLLPPVSLGLWHNFGALDDPDKAGAMIHTAFDNGITHFDLANNYGPPPGSAETSFGDIFKKDLSAHRDELFVSTKAGHLMWEGPYGDWASRKHLLSSLDQSLKRMRLDYVDVFYIHRYDPETPVEETAGALITAVESGRALYAGISKFPAPAANEICSILRQSGVPCLLHQTRYNIFDRAAETEVFPTVESEGMGCIVFSPLAQGMLTDKYLHGIPADSRAGGSSVFLNKERVEEHFGKIRQLADMARRRGQPLSQMAIAWVLSNRHVTSAIIGASRPEQITDCLKALDNTSFTPEEQDEINAITGK